MQNREIFLAVSKGTMTPEQAASAMAEEDAAKAQRILGRPEWLPQPVWLLASLALALVFFLAGTPDPRKAT